MGYELKDWKILVGKFCFVPFAHLRSLRESIFWRSEIWNLKYVLLITLKT